jgi:hypothetical protein
MGVKVIHTVICKDDKAMKVIESLHPGARIATISQLVWNSELPLDSFVERNAGTCYIPEDRATAQLFYKSNGPFRVVSHEADGENADAIVIYEVHARSITKIWPRNEQETGSRYLPRDLVGRSD